MPIMTTLEALSEAYEGMGADQLEAGEQKPAADLTPIVEALVAQLQEALANQDYDAYVATEEKMQRLDELVVSRLERQVRRLESDSLLQGLEV
jgi:hypothetical protein